jgi:hypothetical protein
VLSVLRNKSPQAIEPPIAIQTTASVYRAKNVVGMRVPGLSPRTKEIVVGTGTTTDDSAKSSTNYVQREYSDTTKVKTFEVEDDERGL